MTCSLGRQTVGYCIESLGYVYGERCSYVAVGRYCYGLGCGTAYYLYLLSGLGIGERKRYLGLYIGIGQIADFDRELHTVTLTQESGGRRLYHELLSGDYGT